jgi:hypothetical protein
MSARPCSCGSDLPRHEIRDARGIFCAYACDKCDAEKRARYRPEIFASAAYEADEAIEPEDY